jgi:hypothetical protein
MPSSPQPAANGIDRFGKIPFHDPEAAWRNYQRISPRLSSALAGALIPLLAESADPDSSLLLLERLVSETSPEIVRLLEQHPFLAHYAMTIFGTSWYLGETLIAIPRCCWRDSSGESTCALCCAMYCGLLLWRKPRRKFLP